MVLFLLLKTDIRVSNIRGWKTRDFSNAGFARSAEERALFRKYIAGGGVGVEGGYNLGFSFSGLTIKP